MNGTSLGRPATPTGGAQAVAGRARIPFADASSNRKGTA
jgi:hypothetical protein